jgi:hypothetical protein
MGEPAGVGVDAASVEERLVYQGEVFINFRNRTRQWVSIKLFALPAGADDIQLPVRLFVACAQLPQRISDLIQCPCLLINRSVTHFRRSPESSGDFGDASPGRGKLTDIDHLRHGFARPGGKGDQHGGNDFRDRDGGAQHFHLVDDLVMSLING